jgi:hypothetical protein
MPPHVLYQIPLATWPVRLIMGAACLFVLVTICVWWLPRSIVRVRNLFGKSRAQAAVGMAVAMISISIAIGFGLLFLLIALIRNPQAYVTDTGVTKANLFHQKPVSFTWEEISHVHCRSENVGAISSIIVVAKDGRRIDLGNTGGVDFASMYELFQNQLGPMVVHNCDGSPKLSR